MSSIVEKDYVLRLVREIAQLLARVVRLVAGGRHDEAIGALEAACGPFLGVDYAPLAMLDAATAAELLGGAARVRAFAIILDRLADVHAARGDEAAAQEKRQHALELYLEAALRGDAPDPEAEAAIRRLAAEVPPSRLRERHRRYLEGLD